MRIELVLFAITFGLLLMVNIARATGPATTRTVVDRPTPALSPQDVVRVVCRAMKENGPTDDGIATAFAFASPANRRATGPLERFIPMVKTPAYVPMLNCKAIELGPGETVDDRVTRQVVTITAVDGTQTVYLFILSKQADGEYKDCWMTDGVMPARPTDAPDDDGDRDRDAPPAPTQRV